jgi:hypothetical protein
MEDKNGWRHSLYYKDVDFNNIDHFRLDSLDNEQSYYLSSLIDVAINPRLSVNCNQLADEVHSEALDYYRTCWYFDRTKPRVRLFHICWCPQTIH